MEFKRKPQSLPANVNWIKTPRKYASKIDDISKFRIMYKKCKTIKRHNSRNLINQVWTDWMKFLIFAKISGKSYNYDSDDHFYSLITYASFTLKDY